MWIPPSRERACSPLLSCVLAISHVRGMENEKKGSAHILHLQVDVAFWWGGRPDGDGQRGARGLGSGQLCVPHALPASSMRNALWDSDLCSSS